MTIEQYEQKRLAKLDALIRREEVARQVTRAVLPSVPPRRRRGRAVRCVETQQRYVSLAEAAEAMGIFPNAIRDAVLTASRAAGYRWEWEGP